MNELGNNIARYRKEKGISQEKLAEYMEISRQAVTKWESGTSKPSTENLLKLSELFGVEVEHLLSADIEKTKKTVADVSMGKAPWIWCMISIICVVVYYIYGILNGTLYLGTLICIFVIAFPVQLFLNLCFSNALQNQDYQNIAGFHPDIHYNMNEVKKLLVNINQHVGMVSTFYIFLICIESYSDAMNINITGLLVFFYVIEVVGTIVLLNYRAVERIYCDETDEKKAKLSWPITIVYLLLLLVGTIIYMLVFEVKGFENNTVPAFILTGILVLGIIFATIGYFKENKNVKNWSLTKEKFKISKFYIICFLLTVVSFITMFFVGC